MRVPVPASALVTVMVGAPSLSPMTRLPLVLVYHCHVFDAVVLVDRNEGVVAPLAVALVKTPVDGVVAPIGVLFRLRAVSAPPIVVLLEAEPIVVVDVPVVLIPIVPRIDVML
jgi:hypothetical protein